MVAISACICNKDAKIIFARQFSKISRMELEEYIVQFSRNIDNCKEITHFESDKVRYIFITIDDFYLILITNKNSNIIEDTEILKLIYRLLKDICGNITQDSITENCFELMLGMDDIVSLGYRNGVNLAQIKTFLQMESAEEKEFKRKKREQEMEQQKLMYIKSKEFDKLRREKKFMKDAISSSDFNTKVDLKEEQPKEKVIKELNIGKKIEKEEEKEEKEIKIEKKVGKKGGLKLGKKKNFN